MLPQPPKTEPETSFEALVVKKKQSVGFINVMIVNVTSQSKNPEATNRCYCYIHSPAIIVGLLLSVAGCFHR